VQRHPFSIEKEERERLEYKTTGRQIKAVQGRERSKAKGNTLKRLNACEML